MTTKDCVETSQRLKGTEKKTLLIPAPSADVVRRASVFRNSTVLYPRSNPVEWGQHNKCHSNVKRMVEKVGGNAIHGWAVLHRPYERTAGYLLCFHHSNWRSPEGEVVDITPHRSKSAEAAGMIVVVSFAFVEDPKAIPLDDSLSLPTKVFALSKSKPLLQHVGAMRQQEYKLFRLDKQMWKMEKEDKKPMLSCW